MEFFTTNKLAVAGSHDRPIDMDVLFQYCDSIESSSEAWKFIQFPESIDPTSIEPDLSLIVSRFSRLLSSSWKSQIHRGFAKSLETVVLVLMAKRGDLGSEEVSKAIRSIERLLFVYMLFSEARSASVVLRDGSTPTLSARLPGPYRTSHYSSYRSVPSRIASALEHLSAGQESAASKIDTWAKKNTDHLFSPIGDPQSYVGSDSRPKRSADLDELLSTSLFRLYPESDIVSVQSLGYINFYRSRVGRYILYEYEDSLRKNSKAKRKKIRWSTSDLRDRQHDSETVEHILPQNIADPYWQDRFGTLDKDTIELLTNSLGNLVLVSRGKNSALSNKSFGEKKGDSKSADTIGYRHGGYAEIELCRYEDWTPKQILDRGLELLKFVENNWTISLGDEDQKVEILGLTEFTGS